MSESAEYSVYDRPMRLSILQDAKGCNFLQRLQMWPIKMLAGVYPAPHCVLSYHRTLYGKWFARFMQQAMRGSDHWTKAELELFGAFTAKVLACDY